MEYTSVAFERSYVFQSFVIVCVLLVIKPTHGTCSRENLSAFCNYLLRDHIYYQTSLDLFRIQGYLSFSCAADFWHLYAF